MSQVEPADTLHSELRQVVVEVGQIAPDFDAQANFYTELGMPSVKALQLLMELEDRYQIQIKDEDFVEATSLNNLYSLIRPMVAA